MPPKGYEDQYPLTKEIQKASYADRVRPMPLDGTKPLWNRQSGESAQSYEAFMMFLMVPSRERTRVKVAEMLGKSGQILSRWAQKWSWDMRAAAYEEHVMLLSLESHTADVENLLQEHRKLTLKGREVVNAHLDMYLSALENGTLTEAQMKPEAVVKLFAEALKADRMTSDAQLVLYESEKRKREEMYEAFANDLVSLVNELMDECEMDDRQRAKAQDILLRHLAIDAEEEAEEKKQDGLERLKPTRKTPVTV